MKRILAALMAVIALVGSVVVAQAATLTLDAGTLQALRVTKSPEIPDTVQLTVRNRVYAAATSNIAREYDFPPYLVPEGSSYEIGWSQSTTPCLNGTPTPNGVGEHPGLSDDFVHYVCSRTNQTSGEPIVTVDGKTIEPGGGS
jgi:hypothetical protein